MGVMNEGSITSARLNSWMAALYLRAQRDARRGGGERREEEEGAVLLEVLEHSGAVVVQVGELDGDALGALEQRATDVCGVVAGAVEHARVPEAHNVGCNAGRFSALCEEHRCMSPAADTNSCCALSYA